MLSSTSTSLTGSKSPKSERSAVHPPPVALSLAVQCSVLWRTTMSVPPLVMKALLWAASPSGLNWSCSQESSTTQWLPQCTLCWPPVTSTRRTVMLLPHTAPPIHSPATTSESTTSTENDG